MIRARLRRPLLALALLPAAGGIALASVGGASASSAHPEDRPTAHVQTVRHSPAPVKHVDDRGGARTKPRPVEAGDDSGGHGGRTNATGAPAPRHAEPRDDHGGTHVVAARTASARATEPGDDSGGHGGRTNATRTPEKGDDTGGSGSHGGHGRHGGSDDGPDHS